MGQLWLKINILNFQCQTIYQYYAPSFLSVSYNLRISIERFELRLFSWPPFGFSVNLKKCLISYLSDPAKTPFALSYVCKKQKSLKQVGGLQSHIKNVFEKHRVEHRLQLTYVYFPKELSSGTVTSYLFPRMEFWAHQRHLNMKIMKWYSVPFERC